MVYMDANASEPLRPEARAAAQAAMEVTGNPSSVHQAGRAARRVLEAARESLAERFRARAQDIVFTSGATEANALAIHALGRGRPILIGATEHDAVRAAAPEATVIPVLPSGLVDLLLLDQMLAESPNALVCLMAANNETGVLHDIAAAAWVCAAHGALLHVDAAQAAGRCPEDWLKLGAASFALSGHKAGGPLGAGALVFSSTYGEHVAPLLKGGGQERGWRGGTPGLPAIAGMAVALDAPYETLKIAEYRDDIEAFCVELGAQVMGADAARLPNTVGLALPGVRADTQLIALDTAGVAVSAGSACSSGKVAASHVLVAMGMGALAGQAIRVSLPWNVTKADCEAFKHAYQIMARRALHHGAVPLTEARSAD
ncbi:MAG: aminotransferase class V-fold PLP-dependent enzyme [Acidocella sp.]|nr:aminotransferase class V-fold PLP-dependent enzyme [Acidocella sp.]